MLDPHARYIRVVRITYDPTVDAAYIYLRDPISAGESKRQETCDIEGMTGDIRLDFNAVGILLGIEVLGASRILPGELIASTQR